MSGATPTLIPRVPNFPILLPRPPQPHIKPKARRVGPYTTINQTRDLQREMDELSEEETELEEANMLLHNRGYNYMVPIGRTLTLLEEKNDADEEDDGEDSGSGSDSQSQIMPDASSEAEPDADPDASTNEVDLDASMDDMDQDQLNTTYEEEDEEEEEEVDEEDDEEEVDLDAGIESDVSM